MVPPLLGVGLLAAVANPPRAPTLVLRVQYDGTDLRGEQFDLLSSEQGIGRDGRLRALGGDIASS